MLMLRGGVLILRHVQRISQKRCVWFLAILSTLMQRGSKYDDLASTRIVLKGLYHTIYIYTKVTSRRIPCETSQHLSLPRQIKGCLF